MTVTPVGTPALTRSTTSPVTGTWGTGQNRTAGNLLIAAVSAGAATSVTTITASGSWALVGPQAAEGHTQVAFFSLTAAGGDAAPSFSSTLTSTAAMSCTLYEFTGGNTASPGDTWGTSGLTGTTANPLTVTTAGNVAAAGEYALCCHVELIAVAATVTWTPDAAFTNDASDAGTSTRIHAAVDHLAAPAAGSASSCGGTWGTAPSHEAAQIIVIAAATGAAVRAAAGPVRAAAPPPPRGRAQGRTGTYTAVSLTSGAPACRPVQARLAPAQGGRVIRRAGTYAGSGPPAPPLHQPAGVQRRQPPPARGRITSQHGTYSGTGPVAIPLRRPVRGQPQKPLPAGRTASRTGVAVTIVPAGGTGTVTWTAAPAPLRWQALPGTARWTAAPALPRWRTTMTIFQPISALSLVMVNVSWTSDLDGTRIDPTGQTAGQAALIVQFAFPLSSGNYTAPAEPVTWYTGSWLLGGTGRGYIAQCLVGPGGGAVTLTAGQSYDVWSKITGTPESPAIFAGTQPVY
jgi:hypothetical protein